MRQIRNWRLGDYKTKSKLESIMGGRGGVVPNFRSNGIKMVFPALETAPFYLEGGIIQVDLQCTNLLGSVLFVR